MAARENTRISPLPRSKFLNQHNLLISKSKLKTQERPTFEFFSPNTQFLREMIRTSRLSTRAPTSHNLPNRCIQITTRLQTATLRFTNTKNLFRLYCILNFALRRKYLCYFKLPFKLSTRSIYQSSLACHYKENNFKKHWPQCCRWYLCDGGKLKLFCTAKNNYL